MTKDETGSSTSSAWPDLSGVLNRLADLQEARVDSYRIRKISKFHREDPSCWFILVEASFVQARITDEITKAHSLLPHFDVELIPHIRDLVLQSPPPARLYTLIKERLLSAFAASSEARLRQLLRGEVSPDGKPSLILNHLRALNDSQCGGDVIKSIFLDQLPVQTRAILTMANVDTLEALAVSVDKVAEAANASPLSINSAGLSQDATQPATYVVSSSKSNSLATLIEKLTLLIEKLPNQPNDSYHTNRGRTQQKRSNGQRSHSRSRSRLDNRRCI